MIKLRIITPNKVILEEDIKSITVPGIAGEMTILPNHANLFTLLSEGVVKINFERKEDYLAIGGGYLETNGNYVNLLVSRAYGQDIVNQTTTEKALKDAKNMLIKAKSKEEKIEANTLLRRSIVDMKLIKKRRKTRFN
ncbi:MAG: ATP synthase F1 subunit epsilon [bacterium]